jgi:hypothetical protein
MSIRSSNAIPFIWKDAFLEFIIIGPLAGALYLLLGGDVSAFAVTMPAAALVLTWGLATRRYHYVPGATESRPAVLNTPREIPAKQVTSTQHAEAGTDPASQPSSLSNGEKQSLVQEVHGSPCPYCGTTLNANNATLDFMDPLCRGGREEARNVSVCCNVCEGKKSGRSFADWLNSLEEPYLTIAWDLYQSRRHGE